MRHSKIPAALLALLVPLAGCSLMRRGTSSQTPTAVDQVRAEVNDASGRRVGEVRAVQTTLGVLLTADFTALPPGTHAMHLHGTGRCEAPFESAGPHFNPTGRSHGFRNAGGQHAGDLPNIYVPEGGALRVDVLAHGARLQGAGGLLDEDGASIVVHAFPDDYITEPAGGAGARIACGVLRP
jgi:Cu-Zn family superoxide dismutase